LTAVVDGSGVEGDIYTENGSPAYNAYTLPSSLQSLSTPTVTAGNGCAVITYNAPVERRDSPTSTVLWSAGTTAKVISPTYATYLTIYGTNWAPNSTVIPGLTNGTSYSISGLLGLKYAYRNAALFGPASGTATVTPTSGGLAAPTGISGSINGETGEVSVGWAAVSGATGYILTVRAAGRSVYFSSRWTGTGGAVPDNFQGTLSDPWRGSTTSPPIVTADVPVFGAGQTARVSVATINSSGFVGAFSTEVSV